MNLNDPKVLNQRLLVTPISAISAPPKEAVVLEVSPSGKLIRLAVEGCRPSWVNPHSFHLVEILGPAPVNYFQPSPCG